MRPEGSFWALALSRVGLSQLGQSAVDLQVLRGALALLLLRRDALLTAEMPHVQLQTRFLEKRL